MELIEKEIIIRNNVTYFKDWKQFWKSLDIYEEDEKADYLETNEINNFSIFYGNATTGNISPLGLTTENIWQSAWGAILDFDIMDYLWNDEEEALNTPDYLIESFFESHEILAIDEELYFYR